jgi:hypothetical protein
VIEKLKAVWDKVAGVYEWAAEAYADLVGNYPRIALGLFLMFAGAALRLAFV